MSNHLVYKNTKISFTAYIVQIGELDDFFGHFEYDAKGAFYQDKNENFPKINQKADFCLDGAVKFINGFLIS